MTETPVGVLLGFALVAALTVTVDFVWRLLAGHVPSWWATRDQRTAARWSRSSSALGRVSRGGDR
jgi:hypothetical protein